MTFCGLWWRLQNSFVLNRDIQGSFKKFLLLFRQAEMVFVLVWFLYHFTFKPVPSVNDVWIIKFVSHHHAWVTKCKPLLMFFQLPILTSNNVVWISFCPVLFDEVQHLNIVKAKPFGPTAGIIRSTQQRGRRHLYYNFRSRLGYFWSVGRDQLITGASTLN